MSDPRDAHLGMRSKVIQRKLKSVDIPLVRADDLTVGTDNEQNIVNVYYSKDTNEDDIPDRWLSDPFTYVSADDKETVTEQQ